MATLKKYNLAGKEVGSVDINDDLVNATANSQMVKDYIVALRNNARQWSANTKTRAEVSHSTKKPHPQKGGGRARQGSLAAPQYKGGGRVFTPRPKFDQHVRINKKERKAAIRFLLGEKIKDEKLMIIEDFNLEAPQTKAVANFIKKIELTGRTLFLGEGTYHELKADGEVKRISAPGTKHENFIKSMRNIQKIEFNLAPNVNGYDVIVARNIVMTQSAFDELNELLK